MHSVVPRWVCGIGDTGHGTPWTPLTFTTQGDNSVLVTENDAANSLYTASYKTALVGITGIRLELMPDASFPKPGLGLHDGDGNFVLSEFEAFVKAQ